MSNRHAYCIIAHQDPVMLHVMVAMLDHPLNDIYIHIDKKVDISPFLGAKTKWSKVSYLPARINVEWGGTSQIEAEFLIFEYAFNHGCYSYYHMMSGLDLPLHPQEYIYDFFENKFPDYEFVSINPHLDKEDMDYKTRYYHFFVISLSDTQHSFSHYFYYYLHAITVKVQKFLGVKRKYPFELKKGLHFVSITNSFLSYLLTKKEFILEIFNHTLCADEIFLQTILWNSSFREKLYKRENNAPGNMRKVLWVNHKAHVWKECDYESLISFPELFALKFSSKDPGLLLKMAKHNGCLDAVQTILEKKNALLSE